MKNFNKELFIKNFYFLVKKNDLKIGQMEEKLNVSVGYFSRLKESINVNPNIELICSISDYFNISLDRLLYTDLSGLNVSISYILNVIDYLFNKTKNFEIIWEIIKEKDFYDKNKIECNSYDNSYHVTGRLSPLLSITRDMGFEYKSLFLDGYFVLNNDIFWFENGDDTFYIIQLADLTPKTNQDKVYELYLENSSGFEGVCYADAESNKSLYDAMEKLYNLCLENKKSPKLKKNIKAAFENLLSSKN